jgi:hypothetical protein
MQFNKQIQRELMIAKTGLVLFFVVIIATFMIVTLSGCITQKQSEDLIQIIKERNETKNTEKDLPVNVETKKENPEIIVQPIKKDLDFVEVWKGNKAVKDWEVTTTLKVSTSPKLSFQTTQNWKGKKVFKGNGLLAGNLWIVFKFEGKWTAATWEWFRVGKNITKERSVLMNDFKGHTGINHILQEDETVYFFVSGLIRTGARNVEERSEVVEAIL